MLALLAGRTERVRLGTGIVIAALRGGAVLAKTAATLDLVSGGRFDLGVGTGWQKRNTRSPAWTSRSAVRCSTMPRDLSSAVVRRPGGSVDASLSFDDAYCSPRPPAGRSIPIWVSGSLSKPSCAG
ncbi:LLM class flavin-dependent oxidoreductase [Rhodococcus hoagii]|nr:LLM class flavin-dependent oxidoreductase [Prescottella equi]